MLFQKGFLFVAPSENTQMRDSQLCRYESYPVSFPLPIQPVLYLNDIEYAVK